MHEQATYRVSDCAADVQGHLQAAAKRKQMILVTAGFAAFSTSLAESFGGVTSAATANPPKFPH
jgi:hypothetical protein